VPVQVAVASAFQVLFELEAAIIIEAARAGTLKKISVEKSSADNNNVLKILTRFNLLIPASPSSINK
jgi:hypothetical protein